MPPDANEITELPVTSCRRWARAQKSKYHIYNLQLQSPREFSRWSETGQDRDSDSDRADGEKQTWS